MHRLFAPWRIKYVLAPEADECIFCTAFDRKDSMLITFNDQALAIMNIYPYNGGHILIAPKRHIANYEELTDKEIEDIHQLIKKSILAIKRAMHPDGFNIGLNQGEVAGGSIKDHLHFHIVPRWTGDTNFMPIIADTKIIVEALENTYKKIKKEMDLL